MITDADEGLVDETGFLGGRVRLRQPRRGHRVGTDAALVVAAARPHARGRVIDLGAGVGAIGLSLAALAPEAEITLVEIDPQTASLAAQNAVLNHFDKRVTTIVGDVRIVARDPSVGRSLGAPADLVVMNPPFGDAGGMQISSDPARSLAHVMSEGELPIWLHAAAVLLAPKGMLVLIHRPAAIEKLLAGLRGAFGSVALCPVYPRANGLASRVLLVAKKGGRAPLAITSPLVLHRADGAFTPLAEAIHRGESKLRLS